MARDMLIAMEEIPSRALASLPIFPLPSVVLFPGAVLPLHIFEDRYREMTSDVLSGPKLIGVVRLRPGFERDYQGRPPVYTTAGVGYVLASDQLSDGRYNMLLRGVGRISIERELPPRRAYREVRAQRLNDTRSSHPELVTATHAQLIGMCDRLSAHFEQGGDELRQLVRNTSSPGQTADLVAAALVTDADERQELLEMLDPADRIDRVVEHLSRLLADLGSRSDLPN
jgi:uncharacterized protein